jgi:hypothetical protein
LSLVVGLRCGVVVMCWRDDDAGLLAVAECAVLETDINVLVRRVVIHIVGCLMRAFVGRRLSREVRHFSLIQVW